MSNQKHSVGESKSRTMFLTVLGTFKDDRKMFE